MRGADTLWGPIALSTSVRTKLRHARSFCFTELPRLWPTAILASAALCLADPAQAQVPIGSLPPTATWTPPPNNWNSSSAWTPSGPPTHTGIFPAGVSAANLNFFVPAGTTIGTLVFEAPGYTLNVGPGNASITIFGQGILTGPGPFDVPDNRPVINI